VQGGRGRLVLRSDVAGVAGRSGPVGTGGAGGQVRGDKEEEYRLRVEADMERLASGARAVEQLRVLVRDVDGSMARANADLLAGPGYRNDDDGDEEDTFFLG
jgi:hypothetical protein